jgi:hypothetical protein
MESWMREVDAWTWDLIECSVHDLADQPFADWFATGMSPKEAARKAVRATKRGE